MSKTPEGKEKVDRAISEWNHLHSAIFEQIQEDGMSDEAKAERDVKQMEHQEKIVARKAEMNIMHTNDNEDKYNNITRCTAALLDVLQLLVLLRGPPRARLCQPALLRDHP